MCFHAVFKQEREPRQKGACHIPPLEANVISGVVCVMAQTVVTELATGLSYAGLKVLYALTAEI